MILNRFSSAIILSCMLHASIKWFGFKVAHVRKIILMINMFIDFKQPPPVIQEKQEVKEVKETKQPVKEALSEEELMKKTTALIDEYINIQDLKVF